MKTQMIFLAIFSEDVEALKLLGGASYLIIKTTLQQIFFGDTSADASTSLIPVCIYFFSQDR